MSKYPHELEFFGIYLAPLVVVIIVAFLATLLTAMVANKIGLARYFAAPKYAFLAMVVIYMLLIDSFWIRF